MSAHEAKMERRARAVAIAERIETITPKDGDVMILRGLEEGDVRSAFALLSKHLNGMGAKNVTFLALPAGAWLEQLNDELLDAAGLMRKTRILAVR
jgi:hypothetical protein